MMKLTLKVLGKTTHIHTNGKGKEEQKQNLTSMAKRGNLIFQYLIAKVADDSERADVTLQN